MSDYHQAIYEICNLPKQEITTSIIQQLPKNKIRFLSSVRRFFWDKEFSEFSPDLDYELDNLSDFSHAIRSSYEWSCTCFDIQFLQWALELYIFNCESPEEKKSGFGLSFPDSLYKLAKNEINIATQWLNILVRFGILFGNKSMICGPEISIQCYDTAMIKSVLLNCLRKYQEGTLAMHTAIFSYSLVNKEILDDFRSLGYSVIEISDQYLLLTLLEINQNFLKTEIN